MSDTVSYTKTCQTLSVIQNLLLLEIQVLVWNLDNKNIGLENKRVDLGIFYYNSQTCFSDHLY